MILIGKIEKVLNEIDNERVYSAIYMGKKDKKDIKNLKLHRDKLDIALKNIGKVLEENSELSIYQTIINHILKNLSYTRTRVDVLSLDYQNIFFENYYIKVVKPFIELIDILRQNPLFQNNQQLSNYFQLLEERENLSMEKSFISFFLNASAKMNQKDLLLWESFIDSDIIEEITLKTLRGVTFIESTHGKYSVSCT